MFGKYILNYWDDIMEDLSKMISINSVAKKQDGMYPYGKNAANAIDLALDLSNKYGLKCKNIDYYAFHAEIGEGSENAVVMSHLDVVPAGENWNSDPFTLTNKDGKLYGRGIVDNKGPSIIALHCLRALKDHGVIGKRKLRIVFGSGEEVGMDDMEYYFSKEQEPTLGFTPDGVYGICHCEKGILHFNVKAKNDCRVIKIFKSGTALNAVPYKAECEIFCSESEFLTLELLCNNDFELTKTDDGAKILSKGTAAHASTPELGKNAASLLLNLLFKVFSDKMGTLPSFINKYIGTSYDGSPMNINFKDSESGALTFNLGLVSASENTFEIGVDIRYPATKNYEEILTKIQSHADEFNLSLSDIENNSPLYMKKDSSLVKLLNKSYKEVTGKNALIYSMGGGTYARQMKGKGLAFGPSFSESDTHIHDANECISEDDLKLHAQICLQAMYNIFTTEEVT